MLHIEMTRTLKEMPDVRADKVADLKERIANGTYNISGCYQFS